LGNRLQGVWERFRDHFKTKTHNVGGHAWTYLQRLLRISSGVLLMLKEVGDQASIVYMAEIPEDTQVYLTQPDFGMPPSDPDNPGRPWTRQHVLSGEKSVEVRQIVSHSDTHFPRFHFWSSNIWSTLLLYSLSPQSST
jgi:hypothetical protein